MKNKVFILVKYTECNRYIDHHGDSPSDSATIIGVYSSFEAASSRSVVLAKEAFKEREEDETVAGCYYKVEEWTVK